MKGVFLLALATVFIVLALTEADSDNVQVQDHELFRDTRDARKKNTMKAKVM